MSDKLLGLRSLLPILVGFVIVIGATAVAIILTVQQERAYSEVRIMLELETQLNRMQTLMSDAETGQRGYILTGKFSYLDPYNLARQELPREIEKLSNSLPAATGQAEAIQRLQASINAKLTELQQTIDLRSSGAVQEAISIVDAGAGKNIMDDIRMQLTALKKASEDALHQRSASFSAFVRSGQVALVIVMMALLLIAAISLRDGAKRMDALKRAYDSLQKEAGDKLRAEEQLRQLQKMEAVGQLTGGIAHDFNNMLAIVIGSLNLAKRRLSGTENPGVAQNIANAVDGAQRAALLTARLLAFSRQQPLDPKVLDANKLIAGMSEMFQRTLGSNIQIETVLSGGLWRICADAAQIENALLNLAVNARDAMPDGGKLTIETGNAELDERYAATNNDVKAGQYVVISVTDTGTGMSTEVMARAFDPFYTTKGVGKGTGLGLSQVFGFVKQSGGHVKLYSEIGQGTTAKIYLPRHKGLDLAVPESARAGIIQRGQAHEIVLVVEDEQSVRHILVESLKELGYTVISAGSPLKALQHIAEEPNITLLLTDIIMPEMNGRQLAEKALVQRPNLKVLYTTGYTRNAIVHNGMLDPGTSFLPKPYSIEQLAAKLREVLG